MHILKKLFETLPHCEDVVYNLLQFCRLKVTKSTIKKDLIEHPDYPSLNAVIDILKNYGITSEAYRIKSEYFNIIPTPFVAHMMGNKVNHGLLVPVYDVSEKDVELYNPESQSIERWNREKINQTYLGVVLALDTENAFSEPGYELVRKNERRSLITNYFIISFLPVLTFLMCVAEFWYNPFGYGLTSLLFTLLTLSGSIITSLLVWRDLDEYNPVIKQICQTSKRVSCSSVLHSKGAKIFGVSWSSIGFSFFTGLILYRLVGGVNSPIALQICSWLNIIALPYIVYSIYYQWRIVKQWCLLCLGVQAILVLQFTVVLTGGFVNRIPFNEIPVTEYLSVISALGFIFLIVKLLIPSLEKAKTVRYKTIELQRLKHSHEIFEALLAVQKEIEEPVEGLGILVGNPDANFKLVKVCNPYCKPCAKAHAIIDDILHTNKDVSLQIVFNATTASADIRANPVRLLLAINDKRDPVQIQQALDDWYLDDKKDYEAFAAKYSLKEELNIQDKKIDDMNAWCEKTNIKFTPTFFINGRQLPEMYTANDLKYFLG